MKKLKKIKIKKSYKTVFSPDGNKLATMGRKIVIWDIVNRKKILNESPLSDPSHLAFSPDGCRLAVKNTSGEIVIIDSITGQMITDFDNLDGEGSNIQFSKCGSFLIDGSWGGQLFIRDVKTGKTAIEESFQGEMITRVHRSGDGTNWIIEHSPLATTYDKTPEPCFLSIFKWPFDRSGLIIFPKLYPFIWSTAVNYNFTKIAVAYGNPDRYLEIVDIKSGNKITSTDISIGGTGAALAWSNNEKILSSVQEKKIVFYSTDNLEIIDVIKNEYPSDVSFSTDGSYVAIGAWKEGLVIPLCEINLNRAEQRH